MRAIAVNGSPRKDWNTATLLKKALEGAERESAQTRLVHLYDLDFKGCTSCFSCKRKDREYTGLCAMRDDLTEVLEDILRSDVLLVGSPIYFFNVTGETRSFMERLAFPNVSYDVKFASAFPGTISAGFIFTMNAPEEETVRFGLDTFFRKTANTLKILNGSCESLCSYETYQFADYAKYRAAALDEPHRAQVRAERFPVDCQKAFEMGARLADAALVEATSLSPPGP